MHEAKKYVQELLERDAQQDQEQIAELREKHLDEHLKPEINSMLVQYLPPHITVKDTDILACVIADIIRFPENYLKAQ